MSCLTHISAKLIEGVIFGLPVITTYCAEALLAKQIAGRSEWQS
jgi:hypothetical protein